MGECENRLVFTVSIEPGFVLLPATLYNWPMTAALERRLRLHVQGPEHRFRAICHPGFEAMVARELLALGIAAAEPDFGAVEFSAKFGQTCALQALLRTPSRIIMRIHDWHAENFGQLEKGLASIPWELYLPGACVPQVDVVCHKSRLYHSDAVAERAVALIAQKLSAYARPDFSENPLAPAPQPQRVLLRLDQDHCLASLDLSGDLLYKRGFERFVEDAPLRETMAASILLAAHFNCYTSLCDPMAGSGVFSIEAAQWLYGPTPGALRRFACMEQPAFKPAAFAHALRTAAPAFAHGTLTTLFCADLDAKACATSAHNAHAGQVDNHVKPVQRDFFALPQAEPGTLLVLNPPYGKRLPTAPVKLYNEIGKKIRSDFSGSALAILCPTPQCQQALQVKPDAVIPTIHGGLRVSVILRNGKS